MQLRWKGGLGVLAAAWLLAACPRYARQPPPYVTERSPVKKASATFASIAEPQRSLRSSEARAPTCISGVVTTSGSLEIPVARARITVGRADSAWGQTTTDDNGRFTWCAARSFDRGVVRTSLHIEKAAFAVSERELDIPTGTTTELSIGLNPTP